jgi:tRNA(Ile)-lysidine synthase
MLEKLGTILKTECRLDPGQRVLVAVSGGADSLCLLDMLWRLGYALVVAHLDHGLRPESQAEAEAVRQAAEKAGAPFRLACEDVSTYAARQRLSLEEAARHVRYRFLFEQAVADGVQAVAVAHTADDQVETVLMHLLRGAGLHGLRGMAYYSLPNAWSETIPLVRPLLSTWREEVLAYLAGRGLKPSQDASNLDFRFYRNRLRHELIPTLEGYNPGVKQRLWRMADLVGEDLAVLEMVIDQAWQECVTEEGRGFLAFDQKILAQQPPGIQRHVVRRGIDQLRPGLRDVDYESIERAIHFLKAPARSRQMDLLAGLRLYLEGERLWLAGWESNLPLGSWPQAPPGVQLSLEIPGMVELGGGWRVAAEAVEDSNMALEQAEHNPDPYCAWLDLERLEKPLAVRTRRPGDRFRPLGMEGHSLKLAELMINLKMPRRARDGWPLVVSGGEVVWVPGYRVSQDAAVGEGTRQAVKLTTSQRPLDESLSAG